MGASILLLGSCQGGGLRVFHSADGVELRASFESMAGDKVKLRREDGKAFELSQDKLCAEDRAYIAENRAVIERINRRLGYRLQLRKIAWPAQVKRGESFTVESDWANAGVAPCYGGGFWALTLKDANNGIVSVLVDEGFDVRDLKAKTQSLRSEFAIARSFGGIHGPATAPGDYAVFVSVGQRDGTPTIALPLADGDGARRYKLGQIRLLP